MLRLIRAQIRTTQSSNCYIINSFLRNTHKGYSLISYKLLNYATV